MEIGEDRGECEEWLASIDDGAIAKIEHDAAAGEETMRLASTVNNA
jgi:hypothetical protein